jgi:hypothetical protein
MLVGWPFTGVIIMLENLQGPWMSPGSKATLIAERLSSTMNFNSQDKEWLEAPLRMEFIVAVCCFMEVTDGDEEIFQPDEPLRDFLAQVSWAQEFLDGICTQIRVNGWFMDNPFYEERIARVRNYMADAS